jgi:hypothetical protein
VRRDRRGRTKTTGARSSLGEWIAAVSASTPAWGTTVRRSAQTVGHWRGEREGHVRSWLEWRRCGEGEKGGDDGAWSLLKRAWQRGLLGGGGRQRPRGGRSWGGGGSRPTGGRQRPVAGGCGWHASAWDMGGRWALTRGPEATLRGGAVKWSLKQIQMNLNDFKKSN